MGKDTKVTMDMQVLNGNPRVYKRGGYEVSDDAGTGEACGEVQCMAVGEQRSEDIA